MSERVRDLLVRGIAAARGQSKQEAKFYLEWVTNAPDADHAQLCQAYLGLAEISDDAKLKRDYLEQALVYDPGNPEARRELAILNGALKRDEIINPDRLTQPSLPAEPQRAQARRFVCRQCGGKMQFDPAGTTLECAYCGHRQSLADLNEPLHSIDEQDFIVAMATAKGHLKSVAMRSIKCEGCGALFMLSPETLSRDCPYCASAYVIDQVEMRELIEPEGVVPFAITQAHALQIELDWFSKQGIRLRAEPSPPSGVYLPAWTFDVAGELTWRCLVYKESQWVPLTGNRAVFANDVLVPASHRLSQVLADEIVHTPLDALVPYDPCYLADWLAETYDLPVGDASIVARSQVFQREKAEITHNIFERYQDFSVGSEKVIVDSYKLILVPLWVTHYRVDGKPYGIVINGRTGNLRAEKPRAGIAGWLANLLGADS
jgi:DNA-directed RNA polymerase subunit RPC12/RpoP